MEKLNNQDLLTANRLLGEIMTNDYVEDLKTQENLLELANTVKYLIGQFDTETAEGLSRALSDARVKLKLEQKRKRGGDKL